MKLLNKYLISLAAVSMVACSSMDVDDNAAVQENFPADFDRAVYMEIHPELRGLQVRDYVTDHNDSVKAAMESEMYTATILADTAEFSQDTATLHKIYITSYYGGASEAAWTELWKPMTKDEITCQTETVWKVVNLQREGETSLTKVYAPITIYYNSADTTQIDSVKGASEEGGSDLTTFVMDASLSVLTGKNMGTTKLDTLSCDTATVEDLSSVGINKLTMNNLKKFNFVDNVDDWAMLEQISLDTLAIALQYVMFGRDHGWAYRKCNEAEASNDPITEEYPCTKLYCVDDSGVIREIK